MSTYPSPRPSNTRLVWNGILQFTLVGILGAFCLPLIYILLTGQRETIVTGLVSAGTAVLAFGPLYFKHAVSQRKKFIADGGDPATMNLWMFGAMGSDWKNREGSF